jgi:predicted metalloprotease
VRPFLTSLITAATVITAAAFSVGDGTAIAAADSGASESVAEDYHAAVDVIADYWAQQAPEMFGIDYEPPTVRGVIDPGDATACGPMPEMNAIYCPRDHSVQFGSDYLELADSIGDVIVYDVVAHEWGHAILAQVPSSLVEDPQELQAECLAGGALGDLARDGVIVVEDGDLEEVVKLFRYSDAPGDAHGTAEQQALAFAAGWRQGPAACFE